MIRDNGIRIRVSVESTDSELICSSNKIHTKLYTLPRRQQTKKKTSVIADIGKTGYMQIVVGNVTA